jgi:hypothetical protein
MVATVYCMYMHVYVHNQSSRGYIPTHGVHHHKSYHIIPIYNPHTAFLCVFLTQRLLFNLSLQLTSGLHSWSAGFSLQKAQHLRK